MSTTPSVPTSESLPAPTWSGTSPITGPNEPAQILIGVQCRQMPVGSVVAFTLPAGVTASGAPWPATELPPTPITNPNQVFMLPADWPAGVEASLTLFWWAQGTQPSPGASLVPIVALVTTAATRMTVTRDDERGTGNADG